MATEEEPVYRVLFIQQDKLYEVYAQYISEETLMGFIEVEKLIFSDSSSVLVDPSEERLKAEFNDVTRCYIPLHTIVRIDEMKQKGTAKIKKVEGSNVTHLPYSSAKKPGTEKE